MFLGTFRLQRNLVRTAGMPKPNLFGHIRASAQFGPNSRKAKNESFLAHSGFSPIWSEQPECRKRMFLGTFGLLANLVQTGRHPPTHPPNRAPPTRAPPTHPPTHPPGLHECFLAHSGFSPIWSEQPECQKLIFSGTFGLQPNLVRTAGMPKRNVFGHIRASGQFGPNRAPPTHPPKHPPTHPGATNVFGHIPASAQFGPNSRNAKNKSFWAHSGFSPIWSEQPECQKGMLLGTFGLQPNLVQTGRRPSTHPPIGAPPTHPPTHRGATNVFGHIPPSARFGPNSRNAKTESFLARSGFSPIWSEQPECRKRTFLGTFGLQANLVQTGHHPPTHPPTHPGATYPGATHVTAKICSHRRVRVEISTRTRWFFLCWKFVIFHAKFMCGVSPYPTQPLFALPLHHWVPLQTLPTVGRLLPLQSVPKTILNFPKPCFQIVL